MHIISLKQISFKDGGALFHDMMAIFPSEIMMHKYVTSRGSGQSETSGHELVTARDVYEATKQQHALHLDRLT